MQCLALCLSWPAALAFCNQVESFCFKRFWPIVRNLFLQAPALHSNFPWMIPWTFCSLLKDRVQGLYGVLSQTQWFESLWFLAETSLRGSYTWVWHQRRWNFSSNAIWIMRRNLVQQKVSLLLKEQHLSMWRPRVPLLTPKCGASESRETWLFIHGILLWLSMDTEFLESFGLWPNQLGEKKSNEKIW